MDIAKFDGDYSNVIKRQCTTSFSSIYVINESSKSLPHADPSLFGLLSLKMFDTSFKAAVRLA
jgi:hypothetical protein